MSEDAMQVWLEKLAFLERELAIAADPPTKFQLGKQIAEAKAKIVELQGTAPPVSLPAPPWKENPFPASKLPRTGDYLIGRAAEKATLTRAWKSPKTCIVQIVAPGGIGKTQLVKKWRESLLDKDDHSGAVRAFDWSFYSQGTQQQASADDFFDRAMRWFGETEPEDYKDPWVKGERLAELVRQQRTLLILDGMEPLQHPPGPMAGELTDPSTKALLQGLQRDNLGLCIVTTREAVPTLAEMSEPKRVTIDLDSLSARAGAELLGHYGVTGELGELRQASVDVDGHALALILLGTYLKTRCEGDVQWRSEALLFQGHERYAAHAHKVMASYESWFEQQDDTGRAAVSILRLMGLFNRPADAGCLASLRAEPPIPGLTEGLFVGSNDEMRDELWQRAIERLRAARLLADEDSSVPDVASAGGGSSVPKGRQHVAPGTSPGSTFPNESHSPEGATADVAAAPSGLTDSSDTPTPGSRPGLHATAAPRLDTADRTLDAHPLVREHFAIQLAEQPDAAREAHRRLYEHLKQFAPELPDNLNDMMPLYHAVAHGCKAGLNSDVFWDVYYPRIHRKQEFFAVFKLGAFGADLAAVSSFFHRLWNEPSERLRESDRDAVLNYASFELRALGRTSDAVQVMLTALTSMLANGEWQRSAIQASNLSGLSLTLGDVSSAVRQGEQRVELADRSDDAFQRMGQRTTLAAALHASGRMKDEGKRIKQEEDSSFILPPSSFTLAAFREAESMQQETDPQYPLLYSLAGYRYCDLLLDDICRERPPWRSVDARAIPEAERDGARSLQSDGAEPADESSEQAIARIREVRNRADKALKWEQGMQGAPILDFALHHLTLGRTWLVESQWLRVEGEEADDSETLNSQLSTLNRAAQHLNQSVSVLRQSGQQDHLPRGLLHRAALWRHAGGRPEAGDWIEEGRTAADFFALAERDLEEAESIAKRGSMLIWQIEAALERCRLALCRAKSQITNITSQSRDMQLDTAREKLEEVRQLIRQTEKPYEPHVPDWPDWKPPAYVGLFTRGEIVGYHCRNREIAGLEELIRRSR